MGLRTKIAAIFVPLLLLAVLAVSATEANHAVGVMVEDLGDSGNVLVNETFEQIRDRARTFAGRSGGGPAPGQVAGRPALLLARVWQGRGLCAGGDAQRRFGGGDRRRRGQRGSAAAVCGAAAGGLAMVAVRANPSAVGRAHLRDQRSGRNQSAAVRAHQGRPLDRAHRDRSPPRGGQRDVHRGRGARDKPAGRAAGGRAAAGAGRRDYRRGRAAGRRPRQRQSADPRPRRVERARA